MVVRTLGGAGAVDGALFGGERLHEPRNELVEASLTNATDHRTQRSCRRRPHLGHRVQQRLLQPGYHRRQVRRQVLHTDRPTTRQLLLNTDFTHMHYYMSFFEYIHTPV